MLMMAPLCSPCCWTARWRRPACRYVACSNALTGALCVCCRLMPPHPTLLYTMQAPADVDLSAKVEYTRDTLTTAQVRVARQQQAAEPTPAAKEEATLAGAIAQFRSQLSEEKQLAGGIVATTREAYVLLYVGADTLDMTGLKMRLYKAPSTYAYSIPLRGSEKTVVGTVNVRHVCW